MTTTASASPVPRRRSGRRWLVRGSIFLVVLVALGAAGYYFLLPRLRPAGSNQQQIQTATVQRGSISSVVTMSGSTDSLLRGNVICNTFNFAGSADIVIDQGTLMTYKSAANSVVFSGKTVKFTATGADNVPTTGLSFSAAYAPAPGSYEELTP